MDALLPSILFLTAEIDCGEMLEDKDIKGYKLPSVRLGLRGGEFLLKYQYIEIKLNLPLLFLTQYLDTC